MPTPDVLPGTALPLAPSTEVAEVAGPSRPSSPPSPCVRLCTLDEQDVCVGCGRTIADITSWSKMPDADKAACVARARERLLALGRPLPPYPPPAVLPRR
ncbi:DUF1289 domain-containing protein [Aquabacterium sp. NJ1]|uniref:DUF1289 domain-containing protein n=1 Tax=Aquabacterium sp. NJ1 TaxID=1538295 RepID=UPI0009DEB6E4|nr:DUF1289 domain-containing protein [Aquabacterium sp. NJ1]